jgi:hypothetical protein
MTDKCKIVERIFSAWLNFPELRFGQFLQYASAKKSFNDIFHTEDEDLALACEEFVKKELTENQEDADK